MQRGGSPIIKERYSYFQNCSDGTPCGNFSFPSVYGRDFIILFKTKEKETYSKLTLNSIRNEIDS